MNKEKERTSVDYVKGTTFKKYLMKHVSYQQLYLFIIGNEDMLQRVVFSENLHGG